MPQKKKSPTTRRRKKTKAVEKPVEPTATPCPKCGKDTLPEKNTPQGAKPYMLHTDTMLTICGLPAYRRESEKSS